jgi:hypothetical protein
LQVLCYNLFGLQQFKVYGDDPIPAGEHQVRMEDRSERRCNSN